MDLIRKIFASTDFSPSSQEAVAYAAFMAAKFGAAIVLAHILEPVDDSIDFALIEISQEELKKTKEALESVARLWRAKGIQIEPHLFRGRPEVEIVKEAGRMECDLIVIGMHGKRGVAHLIMGGVSEKVIRTSPIPVLTVRPPNRKEIKMIEGKVEPVIGLAPGEGAVS